MKQLDVLLLPLDGMLVRSAVPIYTPGWVERDTVRVKYMYIAQEHNTMTPASARTRTAGSGVQRTNH